MCELYARSPIDNVTSRSILRTYCDIFGMHQTAEEGGDLGTPKQEYGLIRDSSAYALLLEFLRNKKNRKGDMTIFSAGRFAPPGMKLFVYRSGSLRADHVGSTLKPSSS